MKIFKRLFTIHAIIFSPEKFIAAKSSLGQTKEENNKGAIHRLQTYLDSTREQSSNDVRNLRLLNGENITSFIENKESKMKPERP